MKITKITNVNKFFEIVDTCKEDVLLLTSEGDILNLKSKLCQYVSVYQLFKHTEDIHLEIKTKNEEDALKICSYFNEYEN